MAADRLAAPAPLDEHRRLAVFAGEWAGEETVFPSRWVAGGQATSHVVARMDLNGFYLIQDTRQTRDGRESFATHGVFTFDREDRLYKLFWYDSLGYYPPAPASGSWGAPRRQPSSKPRPQPTSRRAAPGCGPAWIAPAPSS